MRKEEKKTSVGCGVWGMGYVLSGFLFSSHHVFPPSLLSRRCVRSEREREQRWMTLAVPFAPWISLPWRGPRDGWRATQKVVGQFCGAHHRPCQSSVNPTNDYKFYFIFFICYKYYFKSLEIDFIPYQIKHSNKSNSH